MSIARKLDTTTAQVYLHEDTYLQREIEALEKTEYIAGVVYSRWDMIAGSRMIHNDLSVSVCSILVGKLRGTKCRALSSDMRVVNPHVPAYLYPDVTVVCGKPDACKYDCLANPTFVVEITSPSSVEYDRTTKLLIYGTIPSVQEYMIVSHQAREIMLFRRNNNGILEFQEIATTRVELRSVGCTLELAEIYEDIDFDEPDPFDA